jgi:hypothetical protein
VTRETVAGESRTLRAENTLVDQEKVKRMDLHMVRRKFSPISTIGEWYINQKSFCWTLEDMDRQIQKDGSILPWDKRLKLYGLTAIPYGTYEVITNYSVRFKRVMPLILDVPDFKGIRIHVLNWAEETEGCIGERVRGRLHKEKPGSIQRIHAYFNRSIGQKRKSIFNYKQGGLK